MGTARSDILAQVKRNRPADVPLTPLDGPWIRFADPREQFLEVLRAVGGEGQFIAGQDRLREALADLRAQLSAHVVCSALPELMGGNIDLATIDDPHELAAVDLAVLPGELAVAENAAVWVTGARVRHRVAYFLSQHVALVVPADRLVHNMHEAYAWLYAHAAETAPFVEPRWGAFLSGPSKTADIEQALVIGAHGARSLHVYFTP
ncbi:MAG: hypothetical protein DCC67_19135 [Planctomycetota bacterium]|nr:MAG: hypothetical protein DCC67_19135 [Planctomycetota bacterium]